MLLVNKSELYRFLIRKRLAAVMETERVLRSCPTRKDIELFQVQRFNEIWREAWKNVPFYAEWRKQYDLPETIKGLAELISWPILTKGDLRDLSKFVRYDVPCPNAHIMTGGSTGEPVRLPAWGDPLSGAQQVYARMAYGIKPGDRTFLLWGHEHLYGKGWRRSLNIYKRRFKDWLGDWTRVSAYDLSCEAMKAAYNKFAACRPKFVIGFSSAVLAFVRWNGRYAGEVKSVKVILCTAGPLSNEERAEIERFFGGRLCMEYGSVECGLMAHTRPSDGKYFVFWNTRLLQAIKQPDGEYKNVVTKLIRTYVPLIRYDIGDYLDLDSLDEQDNARSVLVANSIKGRPSEMISFKSGVSFFGALIGDCVKQIHDVMASQIAVDEDGDYLEIRVTGQRKLSQGELDLIKNRFELTVPNADKIHISVVQVEALSTTAGGKTPRVLRI